MRVIVECCLQEKIFNKYYTTLASKLCEHDKNHKFTLQVTLFPFHEEVTRNLFYSLSLSPSECDMGYAKKQGM